MEKKTKGAWLLAQSKNLDSVTGAGAARLETISYAGRVGRLYNLLRRNIADNPNPTLDKRTISKVCQLNGIDRSTREVGLNILQDLGRIDVAKNESVSVLGATSTAVLEVTADIFTDATPTTDEEAVIELSEKVAEKPLSRKDAMEYVADVFHIASNDTSNLIELCKTTAIIDEETDRGRTILFNSNTFRDGQYAAKALLVLEGLTDLEKSNLLEVQEKLRRNGALFDREVERILGQDLYRRLVSVGFFDRMEVSNSTEAVGYIASPNDFQKFGRPFEDDPIDDAKALLASLTYGQTRSNYVRGSITMPDALLRALIAGREIGKNGVRAIGEDYRELEARQVVQVHERGYGRYTMSLLKKDVGELALTIVRGGAAAQEAVLMDDSAATSFKGPHNVRSDVRQKNTVGDKRFVTDALDRLRSGG
ncbi:hypothetical protein [Mesorhizobium sp. WSM2239]|uniref:Uncharacterized protein n=2 Tax=unclassified Mesorhizobium TaxID=325217 RepID=A0AAU8D5J2_9HYPH